MLIYNKLNDYYKDLSWWPAKTKYEVIVGAILTQNTSWNNVKIAISNFKENLNPEFIKNIDQKRLEEIIRPSGFYKQKAKYLKNITNWFSSYNCDISQIKKLDKNKIRKDLLNIKGIGKETADCIMTYALDVPSFVVDAYTKRLVKRFPLNIDNKYDIIKKYFESNIPNNLYIYNQYHALIVENGKMFCKKTPTCDGCPLNSICKKIISL